MEKKEEKNGNDGGLNENGEMGRRGGLHEKEGGDKWEIE